MDLWLGNAHRGYSHTFLCLSCSRQLYYRTCELGASYSYLPTLPTTQCSKRPQHKAPAAPPTPPTFLHLESLTPASCKMQHLPEFEMKWIIIAHLAFDSVKVEKDLKWFEIKLIAFKFETKLINVATSFDWVNNFQIRQIIAAPSDCMDFKQKQTNKQTKT